MSSIASAVGAAAMAICRARWGGTVSATAGLMALVLAATLGILLAANPIHRLIGDAGASVVSRVMGMILAAVAVDAVLAALGQIGALPPTVENSPS